MSDTPPHIVVRGVATDEDSLVRVFRAFAVAAGVSEAAAAAEPGLLIREAGNARRNDQELTTLYYRTFPGAEGRWLDFNWSTIAGGRFTYAPYDGAELYLADWTGGGVLMVLDLTAGDDPEVLSRHRRVVEAMQHNTYNFEAEGAEILRSEEG
jgi:hypothetical protein